MKNLSAGLAFACIALGVYSCKKDNNIPEPQPQSIEGKWKFVSASAEDLSTDFFNENFGDKKVTTSRRFKSTRPKGTMTITNDSLTLEQIQYDVSDTSIISEYSKDAIVHSMTKIAEYQIQPWDYDFKYKRIGQDSLLFTGWDIFNTVVYEAPMTLGSKFTLKGDQLTFSSTSYRDSTFLSNSISINRIDLRSASLVFQKQ